MASGTKPKVYKDGQYSDPVYKKISRINGEINRLTKQQLKDKLKEHQLDTRGVKEVLRKRLKNFYKCRKLSKSTARTKYDYLAVIDFEATCDEGNTSYRHEIIEFPIVLIDVNTREVDLINPLMRLSLRLQKENSTLSESYVAVSSCVKMLQSFKKSPNDAVAEISETGVYQGVKLRGNNPNTSYVGSIIDSLTDSINTRFDSSNVDIMSATKILDFSHWPESNSEEFKDFGVECVQHVCDHFSNTLYKTMQTFDPDEAVRQWNWFKTETSIKFEKAKGGMQSATWKAAYDDSNDSSMIMRIVDLLLTMPPTSVACETCFSQMKLVKTTRRTRLQRKTLNDLLVVRLASPSMQDFNPDQAIDHWMVDKIQEYVKPVVNPILSKFCVQLTGITQDIVDKSDEFPEVLKRVEAWMEEHHLGKEKSFAVLTDGPWDMFRFMHYQCKESSIPMPSWSKKWVNVRKCFCNYYGIGRGGIEIMLNHLGMKFEGTPHSGMDDSLNIARIAIKLLQDGCALNINECIQLQHNICEPNPEVRYVPVKQAGEPTTNSDSDDQDLDEAYENLTAVTRNNYKPRKKKGLVDALEDLTIGDGSQGDEDGLDDLVMFYKKHNS